MFRPRPERHKELIFNPPREVGYNRNMLMGNDIGIGSELFWVETIQRCPTCRKPMSIAQVEVSVTTECSVLQAMLPVGACTHCHQQEVFGRWSSLLSWMSRQTPTLVLEDILEFSFGPHPVDTWVWLEDREVPIQWISLVDALDETSSALAYDEMLHRITREHDDDNEVSTGIDWIFH
jgi:hypothetical protein